MNNQQSYKVENRIDLGTLRLFSIKVDITKELIFSIISKIEQLNYSNLIMDFSDCNDRLFSTSLEVISSCSFDDNSLTIWVIYPNRISLHSLEFAIDMVKNAKIILTQSEDEIIAYLASA